MDGFLCSTLPKLWARSTAAANSCSRVSITWLHKYRNSCHEQLWSFYHLQLHKYAHIIFNCGLECIIMYLLRLYRKWLDFFIAPESNPKFPVFKFCQNTGCHACSLIFLNSNQLRLSCYLEQKHQNNKEKDLRGSRKRAGCRLPLKREGILVGLGKSAIGVKSKVQKRHSCFTTTLCSTDV